MFIFKLLRVRTINDKLYNFQAFIPSEKLLMNCQF